MHDPNPIPPTCVKMVPKCVNNEGFCLEQTDFGYIRDPNCTCNPEICPNNFVCGGSAPKHIMTCHGGRCLNCDTTLGCNLTLSAKEDNCECCDGEERLITVPICEHKICISCFRYIYFTDENEDLDEEYRNRCPVPTCTKVMVPAWKN
jgi:hypothetical protein